jgi:hypothetical protein
MIAARTLPCSSTIFEATCAQERCRAIRANGCDPVEKQKKDQSKVEKGEGKQQSLIFHQGPPSEIG